ncbi:MAG TPA: serine/threonine-protein kinase, partial [Isosphaeraceae bacterium]|nr:serine/threonine-protein kinase [Isosphaeraceae bacterium]
GLVHRDIKPSNLMVTPDGDAKMLDLGLARATGEESPLTRPNVVIGTLDYASPEQLSDAARADQRSDLYSVGCSLYFTLAGHPPFEGGDVVNKIFKQRMEDPEPLESAARGVPSAFAAIVRKLMAKDPADRYQSGRELRRDLERWTDPAIVKAILGTEAEAARAFRPPPPDLDDEDLRFFDGVTSQPVSKGSSSFEIRQFGEAEPGVAPLHRPPPPPKPAVMLEEAGFGDSDRPDPPLPPTVDSDMRWLIWLAAGVISLVAVVLVLIAVLK